MTNHRRRVIPKIPEINFLCAPLFQKKSAHSYSHHIPEIPEIPLDKSDAYQSK
jgi:hypothetical protein